MEKFDGEYNEINGVKNVLTSEAQHFLIKLQRNFNNMRIALLEERDERQLKLNRGENPQFLQSTTAIRQDSQWKIAPIPHDLERRWVEITGPTDRKMIINALNSGANVFMADFEDSNSPTWKNIINGQQNLIDAVSGTISYENPDGKQYKLNTNPAVLMVRPRGWHLEEKNYLVDHIPISASLFDFGLFLFHNAKALINKGSGPYFYLPKLENHLEARLWKEVFEFSEKYLGIPLGTIKVTVLIETILAAFEMEEILFELKDYITGLNAGRWDYIFSIIKKFRYQPNFIFPDRDQITMTIPFMKAYTDLLVQTCHKRGAYAMGGMSAFVPSRKDSAVNEAAFAKVKEDKKREVDSGFDGTWVAHPDLVKIASDVFKEKLQDKDHQLNKKCEDVQIFAQELINFEIKGGKITEEGFKKNISIALQYLKNWLSGVGAVTIFNLMEDLATAEISRSQLWQWIHHPKAKLENGKEINEELYNKYADTESKNSEERKLLDHVVLRETFTDFLSKPGYETLINKETLNVR